jgi:hypothetical protein
MNAEMTITYNSVHTNQIQNNGVRTDWNMPWRLHGHRALHEKNYQILEHREKCLARGLDKCSSPLKKTDAQSVKMSQFWEAY